ncbi:MAG: HAMP domain-containing histidine kinase [Cyanobacteria bacterium SZAS TMP-1]|nr:HAMP domain-containing histidine kinase [Cyanobacteria bacterium SZAS TMP-1]
MSSKTSWSGLSLSTKGLILLAIPLCLQIISGATLFYLQQEAEAEAQRALEAQTISAEINNLMADMLKLVRCSRKFEPNDWEKAGYKGFLSPEYRFLMQEVRRQYAKLDEITRAKPALNRTVMKAKEPFDEAMIMFEAANKEILAGNIDKVLAANQEKSNRLQDLCGDFVSQELLVLAKNQEIFAEGSTRKQGEIRRQIVYITFAMVLAMILLSLMLARFLVQTITSRLKIMSDNAVRLASQQPLHRPIEGSDEIAELDHAFHRMADSLDEAAFAKQELYNMLTHDLRTPLTAIQGSLEMLSMDRGGEFNERSKKLIKVAMRNSTRTMGLVNDLLDSQKLEANMLKPDTEKVHLEDIFEGVNLDLKGWIEEKGLHLTFEQTEITVLADEGMLGRILFNLISNAIKYSPAGGTIAIKATAGPAMAEITVTDEGPGIPRHMLKTVFDRFQQIESRDGTGKDTVAKLGSGLGLSICQQFVELHGGKIWVTSEVGHGSVFHFTVPLA